MTIMTATPISTLQEATARFSGNDKVATLGYDYYYQLNLNLGDDIHTKGLTFSFWVDINASGTMWHYGNSDEGSSFDSKTSYMQVVFDGSRLEVNFATDSASFRILGGVSGQNSRYIALSFFQVKDSKEAKVKLYVDDEEPIEKSVQLENSLSEPMTLPSRAPLYLGTAPPNEEGHITFNDLFVGSFSDFRLWAYAMKPRQVHDDITIPLDAKGYQSLILALPLSYETIDQQAGIAKDLTGNNPAYLKKVTDQGGILYSSNVRNIPTEDRSLEMWLRCGRDGSGTVFSYGDYSNSHEHMNEGTNAWQIDSSRFFDKIRDGNWHHVVIVVESGKESIYVDSVQMTKNIGNGFEGPDLRAVDNLIADQILVLGAKNTDETDGLFNGQLRDVFLWKVALNGQQIKDRLSDLSLSKDQKKNITSHWPLVSGAASLVTNGDLAEIGKVCYKKEKKSLSNFEVWRHHHHITSRSSLCEENLEGGKKKSVYRTSITLPLRTKSLTISASEDCDVEIEDTIKKLIANVLVTVSPNIFSKVQISIAATDVRCPTFKLHADWMNSKHDHYLLPDVEYHKRISNLKGDALSSASSEVKTQLGMGDFTKSHIDDLQKTIQSISSTVQHTYNATHHGVHRDRALLAKNMQDSHFKIEFENKKPTYTALTKEQVQSELNTSSATTPEANGFFSRIENDLSKVEKIMVHTVKDAAKEIIDTGVNVGSTIGHTVIKVGEDIVHGDLNYANQDLIAGGESVASELVHGGGELIGQAIKGAQQLLVLTIHTDAKVVQYLITHTGDIGKFIGIVLKKVGIELQSFINWLLEKLDWDSIKKNHVKLESVINSKVEEISKLVKLYQSDADTMFDTFIRRFEKDISPTLNQFDGKKISNKPIISHSHSGAVEKLEWLLGKLARSSVEFEFPLLTAIGSSIVGSLSDGMKNSLGKDGEKLWAAIKEAGLHDLQAIFTHPGHTFDYIVDVFIKLAKTGAVLAIDMMKQLLDAFMKAMLTLLEGFKKSINKAWSIPFIEDLYKTFVKPSGTMTMLDLTCLLIAVPVTITAKSHGVSNDNLFSRRTGTPLTPLKKPGWSWSYGACHILLGVITPIADIRTLCANLGGDLNREFNASAVEITPSLTGKAKKTIDPGLQTLTIVVGFCAQLTTNPIPPDETYVLPPIATRNDIYESPNYLSHVIYAYQWIGWGLGSIAGFSGMIAGFAKSDDWEKYFGRAGSIFNCVFGIGHLIMMGILDHRDRVKANSINYCYENVDGFATMKPLDFYKTLQNSVPAKDDGHVNSHNFTNNSDPALIDWVEAIKNYHIWSKLPADGGIPVKGFGNIMDTFPELGQIASYPDFVKKSEGYSMLATLGFDVFGHMGEGITVMVRTSRNEML